MLFSMAEKKKIRAVLMSDADFQQCVSVSGPRGFSGWASTVLLGVARNEPPVVGVRRGGTCGREKCGKPGAFWRHKVGRGYLCSACAAACPPGMVEDCRGASPAERRRALAEAAREALEALISCDEELAVEAPGATAEPPKAAVPILAAVEAPKRAEPDFFESMMARGVEEVLDVPLADEEG